MNSQHKAVAKGTNMSHEWIRKEIKSSAEMLHLNEMSVRWVWFFLQFGHLKLKERCWENWREFPERFKALKTFIVSGLNPNLFSLSTRMQRARSATACSLPLGLEIAHIYGSLIPSQWEPIPGMLRLAMWCVLEGQVNKPFNSRPADVLESLSLEMSESRLSIPLDAQAGLPCLQCRYCWKRFCGLVNKGCINKLAESLLQALKNLLILSIPDIFNHHASLLQTTCPKLQSSHELIMLKYSSGLYNWEIQGSLNLIGFSKGIQQITGQARHWTQGSWCFLTASHTCSCS